MGVLNPITEWASNSGFSFGKVMDVIGGFVLLIILCGICGVTIWYFSTKKKFNKKIVVFEKVNGIFQITKRDIAMEFSVPLRKIRLLHLKKLITPHGKYLPRPTIQTGFNTYWYAVGKDGEWVNVGIEDFDEKRKKLNLQLDSSSLRNQRAALQKLLINNYKKESWLQKYAPYIALGILVLLLGVSSWLVADKNIDAIRAGGENLKIAIELTEMQKELLVAMDNVGSTSGIRVVEP